MKTSIVFLATALTSSAGELATGTFRNLGFDDPILLSPGRGRTEEVLNGWTLSSEEGPLPVVTPVGISAAPFSLALAQPYSAPFPHFGSYEMFFAHLVNGEFVLTPTYILKQTGVIPDLALDLQIFYDQYAVPPSSRLIECRINGEVIPIESSPWPNSGIYEFPVAAYAGQEVELEFILGPTLGRSFDIAGFTTVPEPSTWALLGLGGLALGYTWRRGRRR